MSEEEFILSLAGIVFGIGLAGFIVYNIFSLIKLAINKKSNASSRDLNPQFFKALGEFKKNTERRITNLEAIVSDLEEEKIKVPDSTSAGEIKIENKSVRSPSKKEEKNNLRNMLSE